MVVFAMRESELLDFFNAHRRQFRNQGDGNGFVTLMRFNCEKRGGLGIGVVSPHRRLFRVDGAIERPRCNVKASVLTSNSPLARPRAMICDISNIARRRVFDGA